MRGITIGELLLRIGVSQRQLAREARVGASTVNQWIRGGKIPKDGDVRAALSTALAAFGASEKEAAAVMARPQHDENPKKEEDENMFLRKQTLQPATRRAFGLVRDPFADPERPEDVYLSRDIRYVREIMYDTAAHGGFLAVVGESGSGKSTLRRDLISRLSAEDQGVIVIQPYVLGMAATEKDGKPLRAMHIAEAIIRTVSPDATAPGSPEALFRKLHKTLQDSSRAGFRHCLIIEEAHDIHKATLKGLKRFSELEDGLKRLLSIILIGQPELEMKLQGTDASVREVVQRCDVVHVEPVADLREFLAFRFRTAGVDLAALFPGDAVDVLAERLTVARDAMGRGVYLGYPLAIGNLVIACLNLAASCGEARVNADVIRQVQP